MAPLADVLAATQANASTPGGWWGLGAALATAVVALLTLIFRELQRRRSDLDQKVANAVDARFGRTLADLREFEESAKDSLAAAVATAADIESQLRERLDTSEKHSTDLTELLDRAQALVPHLEDSQPTLPALLVGEATSADPQTGLALLTSLLQSELASAAQLERGAVLARDRYSADALAARLYAKAVELHPSSAGAATGLACLRARLGEITVDEALRQVSALARENIEDRDVLGTAFNLYIEFSDYRGMLALADELLLISPANSLLSRNRAIALRHLKGENAPEVEDAFSQAYELAVASGSAGQIANTSRPYGALLLRKNNLRRAREVLRTALESTPAEAQLLELWGDMAAREGETDTAKWCYEAAVVHADNQAEVLSARQSLAQLAIRQSLVGRGILPGTEEA